VTYEDCEVYILSELDGTQVTTLQRPANDDEKAWKAYWKAQGQPWRTEPEIDEERKKYLSERLSIIPDDEQGVYPFEDIKLSRADIEWLLATHDNNRGPIDWNDESQRKRKGLDLRGADLSNEDLNRLPLAKVWFGLAPIETQYLLFLTDESIEETDTKLANLARTRIAKAKLQGTNFFDAQLQGACFEYSQLQGANFFDAQLQGADLEAAQLQDANFNQAQLQGADLSLAQLQDAFLEDAQLQGADLMEAELQGASLLYAQLQGAFLYGAQLQGADLSNAQLQGANLKEAMLTDENQHSPKLADIQWGDTNLTVVDWSQVIILGDEYEAVLKIGRYDGKKKATDVHISEYKTAARAYRQLSVVLRNQGLNEDAARFVFRAQRMQRKVFWYQHKFGQYLFSGFLNLLAGYGYRFWRSFVAYLLVITVFAITYFIIDHKAGPVLSPLGSFVFSMTSFHGRGFFPGGIALDDPLTVVAAFEAFIGLLIEVTFIATLTQRLFGR
jgi:uncharacterized protein YjbI with pentapeptide repeats